MDWLNVVVPGVVSLTVIAGGYFANRKLGISAGQQTLVETLQGTVAAQRQKIDDLQQAFDVCKERLEHVEQSVKDLKDDNFQLRTDLQNAIFERRREPRE